MALFGALTVAFGHLFGLDLDQVALLGVALGAVVGLVPDQTLTRRILAFGIGFVVAWVGYAVRAAVLPDIALGRALVVFGVIIVISAASMALGLPGWAMLVGCAAMVGAYEQTYAAMPSLFATDSPEAATTVLLACAMGVLGTTLVGGPAARPVRDERVEVSA